MTAPTATTTSRAASLDDPAYVALLNDRLATLSPQEVVDWALMTLPGVVQQTAFGLTGIAIRDMIHRSDIGRRLAIDVPLIFIDTLYHFQETLALARTVADKYDTTLHTFHPHNTPTTAAFEAEHGTKLWETDPDIYDYLVKVEPGRRALLHHNARVTITGRRRSQGADRASIPILELDNSYTPPILKLNVLAAWDYKQVWQYIIRNNVPYNPLHDQGYKSIGDWHSTAVTAPGEGERDGRWKGQHKTECGLHKDFTHMRSSYVAAKKRKAQLLSKKHDDLHKKVELDEMHVDEKKVEVVTSEEVASEKTEEVASATTEESERDIDIHGHVSKAIRV